MKIKIEYNNNRNKEALLSAFDDHGNVILKNAKVAIPDEFRRETSQSVFLIQNKITNNAEVALEDSRGFYFGAYQKITKDFNPVLLVDNRQVYIAASKNSPLVKDEKAIIMNENDFNVIASQFVIHEKVLLEKKQKFLFFPKDLARGLSDINADYKSLNEFERIIKDKIERNKKDEEKQKMSGNSGKNDNLNYSAYSEFGEGFPSKGDGVKKKSGSDFGIYRTSSSPKTNTSNPQSRRTDQKGDKFNASGTQTRGQPQTASSRKAQREEEERLARQRQQQQDDTSYYALMAYSHPDMAPFLYPNSALAWAVYFNHNNFDNFSSSKQLSVQDVSKIPGYEDVSRLGFSNSGDRLEIHLYKNNEVIGVIDYHKEEGCFDIRDQHGNKNHIEVLDGGKLTCEISTQNREDVSSFNFEQKNGSYVGDYSINSSGNEFKSDFQVDKDFSLSGSGFSGANSSMGSPSFDMSPSSPSPSFGSDEPSRKMDTPTPSFEYKNEKDWEPPPPPPPPPDYNSSGSYESSGSFSP